VLNITVQPVALTAMQGASASASASASAGVGATEGAGVGGEEKSAAERRWSRKMGVGIAVVCGVIASLLLLL
jgi:hypothetical protein